MSALGRAPPSHLLKQKNSITLPSGIRIWQPEFPHLTLSHKTCTVQTSDHESMSARDARLLSYFSEVAEYFHAS
uniref:hypothetical protein n=1 Tax=Enterobacter cloacae TaxID=550 RepID=UPI00155DC2C4|nr:hypothetical protein [Enterobacter cloacae]